ncbi:hypothetical protein Tco_0833131, partial [Tanacetum coccineum]
FWETATASTNADGKMELTTRIDGQEKTITEANTEIFKQLALIGYVSDSDRLTFQKDIFLLNGVVDEAAFTSVDVDAGGASTTDIGLEAGQGSENDLQQTKKVYSSALIKLIMRVKKLEHRVKTWQPKRRARVILSDTEEDLEDPSKQERRIAEINQNPSISLVQDEGTSWIQEDAKIQGKTSTDTKILLDQEEPIELVKDLSSGEKGEKEISIANISVSTASATPEVNIAAANLVYIRRSKEKRKDKGKAIMKKDESVQKKSKKQLEQERLEHEEAIRLQEQIDEEEKQRIVRYAEIAKQL